MLLAIDIGNTLTNFAIYDDKGLVESFKMESSTSKSLDEVKVLFTFYYNSIKRDNFLIDQIIISSVVPSLTSHYRSIAFSVFSLRPLILSPGLKTGLQLKVDEPKTVGSDIIAAAVGARKKYGNSLFVADLGTANKYIYIDKDGAFSGLVISPGMMISYEALTSKAASLMETSLIMPEKVIGKNTAECINSGVLNGTIYEIKGFLEAFEKQTGTKLKPIITGGNSSKIKDYIDGFTYEPNLVLDGLYEIATLVKNRRK